MTKKEKALNHLKEHGSITPNEFFRLYKGRRLAAIVHKLKDEGHDIATKMQNAPNPEGGRPITWAKYVFTKPGKSQPSLFN